MDIHEEDGEILITVRWFHLTSVLARLALLTPFVVGAACGVGASATSYGAAGGAVCAALSLLVVGAPFYLLVARALNSSTVLLGEDALVVEHGPVPWARGPAMRRSEIRRVEVVPSALDRSLDPSELLFLLLAPQRSGRRHGFGASPRLGPNDFAFANGPYHRALQGWSVELVDRSGDLQALVSQLPDRAEAEKIRDLVAAWHGQLAPDQSAAVQELGGLIDFGTEPIGSTRGGPRPNRTR